MFARNTKITWMTYFKIKKSRTLMSQQKMGGHKPSEKRVVNNKNMFERHMKLVECRFLNKTTPNVDVWTKNGRPPTMRKINYQLRDCVCQKHQISWLDFPKQNGSKLRFLNKQFAGHQQPEEQDHNKAIMFARNIQLA